MNCSYISAADTAKLIRQRLKKAFPGVKFSVRSSTYSGGASIRVSYTDGPALTLVEAVAKSYEGSGFDGMIDLKYSGRHWLHPDGTATVASFPGTQDSGGYVPAEREWMPSPDCKLVSFCADYVFVSRDYTVSFMERFRARMIRQGADADMMILRQSGDSVWLETKSGHPDAPYWDNQIKRERSRFMIAR